MTRFLTLVLTDKEWMLEFQFHPGSTVKKTNILWHPVKNNTNLVIDILWTSIMGTIYQTQYWYLIVNWLTTDYSVILLHSYHSDLLHSGYSRYRISPIIFLIVVAKNAWFVGLKKCASFLVHFCGKQELAKSQLYEIVYTVFCSDVRW